RVGKGTYHSLCKLVENRVWGIDSDEERVKRLQDSGYRVLFGDGEDSDLWQNMDLTHTRLVLIALPYIQDIKNIQDQLRSVNYPGKVVAIARYEDQIEQLTECGIDRIFNFYTEAGVGFAEESLALLNSQSELSQQN
ncbi:MAG: NAD-binding protein, partial [Gammaproteobacteria bacterium]|nr:NAD-binding protein [Gammaproteobacteria bacterium]